MAYESNAVLRRALQERLSSVGLCPDLKNDESAVAAICEQTGASREEVARELALMRVEKGGDILQRMGLSARMPAFLASVSTTRSMLVQRHLQQLRAGPRFAEEYRQRSQMTTAMLISDLDMFDQPVVQDPSRKRRDFEVERP